MDRDESNVNVYFDKITTTGMGYCHDTSTDLFTISMLDEKGNTTAQFTMNTAQVRMLKVLMPEVNCEG